MLTLTPAGSRQHKQCLSVRGLTLPPKPAILNKSTKRSTSCVRSNGWWIKQSPIRLIGSLQTPKSLTLTVWVLYSFTGIRLPRWVITLWGCLMEVGKLSPPNPVSMLFFSATDCLVNVYSKSSGLGSLILRPATVLQLFPSSPLCVWHNIKENGMRSKDTLTQTTLSNTNSWLLKLHLLCSIVPAMVMNCWASWSLSHRMSSRRQVRTVEQVSTSPPPGGRVACRIRKNQTTSPPWPATPTTVGQTTRPGMLPFGSATMSSSTTPLRHVWNSADPMRPLGSSSSVAWRMGRSDGCWVKLPMGYVGTILPSMPMPWLRWWQTSRGLPPIRATINPNQKTPNRWLLPNWMLPLPPENWRWPVCPVAVPVLARHRWPAKSTSLPATWNVASGRGWIPSDPSVLQLTQSQPTPMTDFNLTPEERELLKQATPQDVIRAIGELIVDPSFWGGIGTSFLNGMARGFDKHRWSATINPYQTTQPHGTLQSSIRPRDPSDRMDRNQGEQPPQMERQRIGGTGQRSGKLPHTGVAGWWSACCWVGRHAHLMARVGRYQQSVLLQPRGRSDLLPCLMHSLPPALTGGGHSHSFVNQQLPVMRSLPPGAPYIKTHHYPNLQLTQIDL